MAAVAFHGRDPKRLRLCLHPVRLLLGLLCWYWAYYVWAYY